MKDLQVLELNADFTPMNLVPLSVISWQQAFKKIFEGVAYPISYHDAVVHSAHAEYQVPKVIVMTDYKHFNKKAKWSKFNVKLRDRFTCQYCDKRFSPKSLTIDHVIPRSRGGRFTWTNSVAACKKCNNNKGHRMHVKPRNLPYVPSYYELAQMMLQHQGVQDNDWKQYTQFLEKKK